MKTLHVQECRERLALLWFFGAGIIFAIAVAQSLFGRYGDKVSEAWGWLVPTVFPTLALMVSVFVAQRRHKPTAEAANSFLYKVSFWLSTAYLLAVLAVFLLQPFLSQSPLAIMRLSNLWLGPLQGLVAGAIGAFFVAQGDSS